MITITVSTNYSDILNISLPQNARFFEKWLIVTRIDDFATHSVLDTYDFPNVEKLYFDFYRDGVFDKGGALRSAQKFVYDNYQDKIILMLDSDILLPDNFDTIMEGLKLEDQTLYSTKNRHIYYTYQNLLNNKPDVIEENSWFGYFQLYKQDNTKFYSSSYNCDECDVLFKRLFKPKYKLIEGLEIKHLGKTKVNWDGRHSSEDFIL